MIYQFWIYDNWPEINSLGETEGAPRSSRRIEEPNWNFMESNKFVSAFYTQSDLENLWYVKNFPLGIKKWIVLRHYNHLKHIEDSLGRKIKTRREESTGDCVERHKLLRMLLSEQKGKTSNETQNQFSCNVILCSRCDCVNRESRRDMHRLKGTNHPISHKSCLFHCHKKDTNQDNLWLPKHLTLSVCKLIF